MSPVIRKRIAILAACATLLLMLAIAVQAVFSAARTVDRYTSESAEVDASPIVLASEGLNINTASAEALSDLPQIGEKRAEAIVLERETNGFFTYPEDLMDVKGIGTSRLALLRDLIRTTDPQ